MGRRRNAGNKKLCIKEKGERDYVIEPNRRVLEMKQWSVISNAIKTKINMKDY